MQSLISDFCKHPSKQKFNKLPARVRDLFSELSQDTLNKNPHHMLSQRILAYYHNKNRPLGFQLHQHLWRTPASPKDYMLDKIQLNTLLYRGSKKPIIIHDKIPMYFALEIGNANQYLPVTKKGFLGVFRLTKPIILFRLDDLDNINRVLNHTFVSDKSVYKHIKQMFLPPLLPFYSDVYHKVIRQEESDDQPIQFRRLVRYSICKHDFGFTKWLCNNGFNGYSAGVMHMLNPGGRLAKSFPEEIVLCNPSSFIEHVKTISTKRINNRDVLQDIIFYQNKNLINDTNK